MDGRQFLPKEFSWGNELLSSVVVFLVALPLCMGIALASGVSPALGLISGVVGGLVVGLIAGSPLQVSGPAAGLAVIVWEIVQQHGVEGMATALLLAGLIQITAGLFNFGQIFRAITPAVIYGMLAGIGVLIFASQFHMMVDDSPRSSGVLNLISIPEAIYKGVSPSVGDGAHHLAAFIGVLTISSLLLWKRFHPKRLSLLPAPLVAVIVGSSAAALLQLPVLFVAIPSNMLEAIRTFQFNDLLRFQDASLIVAAVTIAFVASAETLLSASAVDQMHDGVRTNYDRELLAQGVGNMLCGMLGALPMTGVIVRSSANVLAGAKTRLSAVFHGLWILIVVLAFPEFLAVIPRAALAAILVYTGFKLVDLKQVRILKHYGRFPLVIYFVTLTGIVVTDLLTGVIIGVVLSLIKVLWAASHLEIEVKYDVATKRAEMTLLGSATFLRLPQLAEALEDIPQGSELHIHLHKLRYIDHACMELLANWEKQREATGGKLVMERQDLLDRCLDSNVGRQYIP
ncbi:MAG: SulP family inorganic anion transporter [Bryobacterales bacterium]|jgi:MFS superfamily sulfate permease-like transporter|nr:SulP family inorganic anion transporter [Bryobacterales bacterium]